MFAVFQLSREFQEIFLFKVRKFNVAQMKEVDFANPFQIGAFTLFPYLIAQYTFLLCHSPAFFSSFTNSGGAQIAGNPLVRPYK